MSNLPEPVSREDFYLAYLNGENVKLPDPVSRVDQYLYNLCVNGGVSGGVSGGNIESIEAVSGILNLKQGNFYTNMQNNTTINLPDVTGYTEIRLWFKADKDLTIIFPNIAWQNEPEALGGYIYEYIFTCMNGNWCGGFVSYEVVV